MKFFLLSVLLFISFPQAALIERLGGFNDNGVGNLNSDTGSTLELSIDRFLGACGEIINGGQTISIAKTNLGLRTTVDGSGRSDTQDFDLLIAQSPGGNTTANQASKALFLIKVQWILYLYNQRNYPGYITPAQIRLKLGI